MTLAAQEENAHSPASVADASLHVDRTVALEKISALPIDWRQSIERAASCNASSSSSESSASSFANRPNSTQDAIDDRNRVLSNDMGKLSISEDTRRILERMDESQVKSAREGLRRVMLQRQKSGIFRKDLGRYTRQGSFRHLGSGSGGGSRGWSILGSDRRGSLGDNGRIDGGVGGIGERRFSSSMDALGRQLESIDDFSDESSDDDSDDEDYAEGYLGEVRVGSWSSKDPKDDEQRFSMPFQPMTSHVMRQLKEEEEIADHTLARIFKQISMKNVANDADEKPADGVRRGGHQHPRSSTSKTWQPLSSSQCESLHDEVDKDTAKGKENETGGIGGIWNKLAEGITSSLAGEVAMALPSNDKPKQLAASAYFRKGRKKADKCEFLPAVALFNLALVRQREQLGEDHVDCGTTLNEIGVCWLMMGERYPALTAFEEALFIRQKSFGVGAKEVAETTNNIWTILHEERQGRV